MAAPTALVDALAAAGTSQADAEMRVLLLRVNIDADHSDPKYLQYSQAYDEARGKAQGARNAVGGPKQALINYYIDNPAELDALFGIA
ncbi:MAG: hypothetical protein RPU14_03825 [Candidatus Sedimenticola sp. (ex Thyasira tokunagai)]